MYSSPFQYPTMSPISSLPNVQTFSNAATEGPCLNFDGWFDSYGQGCTWFEDNVEPGCTYYGDSSSEEGISAFQACCK